MESNQINSNQIKSNQIILNNRKQNILSTAVNRWKNLKCCNQRPARAFLSFRSFGQKEKVKRTENILWTVKYLPEWPPNYCTTVRTAHGRIQQPHTPHVFCSPFFWVVVFIWCVRLCINFPRLHLPTYDCLLSPTSFKCLLISPFRSIINKQVT